MSDQQSELGRFAEPSLFILISLSEGRSTATRS